MRKVHYRPCQSRLRCRGQADGAWRMAGCLCIAAGLVLLFLCIPGWAWAAIAGFALVCAGWALISSCGR